GRAPAGRDLAHGPAAAALARRGRPGLAAAAEPDSAARAAAPALPAGDGKAGPPRLGRPIPGRGQCRRGYALATARKASSASGVPTEMRAPSSPKGRMLIPASPHTAAKS